MRSWSTVALLVYCGSIVLANWLILNVGMVRLPDGTHLVPVGFGLMAPSGSFAAGVTFVAGTWCSGPRGGGGRLPRSARER